MACSFVRILGGSEFLRSRPDGGILFLTLQLSALHVLCLLGTGVQEALFSFLASDLLNVLEMVMSLVCSIFTVS